MNAQIQILRNVLNAILQIIAKKNLMEIHMENVYAMMATMMMVKINYVNNAINFGIN